VTARGVDFFVSYTSADRPWAEWIAWELEHAGHNVIIQAWDILPGANFVLAMDQAARVAERTVAVLSPAFLESPYCAPEWAAAFHADPTGTQRKLVPVRVRDCNPDGLLGSVVYVDVVGLSEAASRAALLAGVTQGRAKPVGAPAFPGTDRGGEGERVRRPETGAAIFNVPVTTRTFVGRLEQLRWLGEGSSGDGVVAITQIHVIHGMGGVGKTQLAARYAREHRDDYDLIWWLRAEQQPTLHADLAGLAVAVGLADADTEAQDAITAARRWLEHNERWLVVFDDAKGPDAIADLLPEAMGGHVLITSRAHADWRALHAQPLALDVWERAESTKFLHERTGEQNASVLDTVAEALGDLPVALEQAAAYTNTNAIALSGYVQELRERAPELFGTGRPADYEHTVSTVWQLAFEQIAQQPVANQLIRVCAHLAPARIPRELLDVWPSVSEDPLVTPNGVDDAIELLLGYSLLISGTQSTVGMPHVLQKAIRSSMDPPARRRTIVDAVRMLNAVLVKPPRQQQHEPWPAFERMLAHALIVTEHAVHLNVALADAGRLLCCLGQYQQTGAAFRSLGQPTTQATHVPDAGAGRVFLCHSSTDKAQVRALYRRLVDDGFDPWLDEENLRPGEPWEPAIRKAVRASDFVVVCLSRAATTVAGYVHNEIKEALDVADGQPDGRIFVIPVRLEDCVVPDRLRHLTWVDLFADVGYSRLKRAFKDSPR
jgi:hypothetical protein